MCHQTHICCWSFDSTEFLTDCFATTWKVCLLWRQLQQPYVSPKHILHAGMRSCGSFDGSSLIMNQTQLQSCGCLGTALPQSHWLWATCALTTPLYTCLGAQSNRGTCVVAPSGPSVGVMYTHALCRKHTLSSHWVCYWYGKLG